jgi:F0F1-type ATP synthase assembly protein I
MLIAFQIGQLGFTLAFSLVGGLLVGLWVDQNLGTVPIFTLLGSLIGITAGSVATYSVIAGAIAKIGDAGQTAKNTHQPGDPIDPTKSEDA